MMCCPILCEECALVVQSGPNQGLTQLVIKMANMLQMIFWNTLSLKKRLIFWLKFVCSFHWWFDWQLAIIGSGKGMMPDTWQAITWIKDDPVPDKKDDFNHQALGCKGAWCMLCPIHYDKCCPQSLLKVKPKLNQRLMICQSDWYL